jgi:hypothetical protein
MTTTPCPFCDWSAKGDVPNVAKALMAHLRLKHARHDVAQEDNIAVSTILSSRTKMGMIEFSLNDNITQWDLDKARLIHRMLGEAIEAAVSDTLIYQFLVQKVRLDDNAASAALLDFRELRQGSRDVAHGGN